MWPTPRPAARTGRPAARTGRPAPSAICVRARVRICDIIVGAPALHTHDPDDLYQILPSLHVGILDNNNKAGILNIYAKHSDDTISHTTMK